MPPQKPDDQPKPGEQPKPGDQSRAAQKVASQEKTVEQPKPVDQSKHVDQPRTGDRQESAPKQHGDKQATAEDSGAKGPGAKESDHKDPPAVDPGAKPPGLLGQQVQENREKMARERAEEQDRHDNSIPRGHATKMGAEANPVIDTEIGQFFRQLSEKITPLINEVSDFQDRVRRERMEAMPAVGDVGELVLERERKGEIVTQGNIDVLSLLKHHLVHVDSIVRANM